MKKFRIKLQNIKLSKKLILIIIITCFLLLFTELAGRRQVYDVYNEQLFMKTAQAGIAYANQVELEIEKMQNVTFSIIGDLNLQEKLLYIKNNPGVYNYQIKKEINTSLNVYCSSFDQNIWYNIFLADGSWMNAPVTMKYLDDYMEIASKKKGKTTVYSQKNKVGIFREIRQINGLTMEHLGVIFLEANLADIVNNLKDNFSKNHLKPNLSIFDQGNCIYTSSDLDENIFPIDEVTLVKDQFLVPYTSAKLGLTFVISIPFDKINEAIWKADVKATLYCIAVATVVCILGTLLIYSIVPHINYLLKKFAMFSLGKVPNAEDYPSYENRTDELGCLHKQFDAMVCNYQRMTQETYQNMLLLKEAQFKQLQQQIRPHFLFNTLSTIVWTASMNGDTETAKIADALGRIMRDSFRNTDNLVTVGREIKLVRDYLYIQDIHYHDRLVVEESFEEGIWDALIPAFTIQPIIENVIIHVVEKSLEVCIVRITGKVREGQVEIVVEDNGGKLDSDILRKLEKKEVYPKGNGVGLSNVDARIKLIFSENYGLKIFSKKGLSRVEIHLPYTTVQTGSVVHSVSDLTENQSVYSGTGEN